MMHLSQQQPASHLPPTSEVALALEASRGQLSAQEHGRISLSGMKQLWLALPSSRTGEEKGKQHPFLPSGLLDDTSRNMCAICTQLRSAGIPLSAHLPCTLRASHSPWGGLPRWGRCPAWLPLLLLLTRYGWAPFPQALGFYPMHAREDGHLQSHASKQGREGDDTCMGAGYRWLSGATHPALNPFPKGPELAVRKHCALPCSSPSCLQGGISFSASGKASQLLKGLIRDDKEGTED